MAKSISVMSFNIWALPLLHTLKEERLFAIRKELMKKEYKLDVICLQEVWLMSDFKYLREGLSPIYPYSYYFQSGVIGSGLCLFSKWPIVDVFYHQWSLNGYFHMIHHADWFGGKGIALATVNVEGTLVNIYTTHFHAQYDRYNDQYLAHRILQAFDTALFIKLSSGEADLSVLAGDLNTEPEGICYRLVRAQAGLSETIQAATSEEFSQGTNECSRNSFSTPSMLSEYEGKGQRIDHILFKTRNGLEATARSFEFPLPSRVPGKDYSFSDHEAISAEIAFVPSGTSSEKLEDVCPEAYEEALHVLNDSLKSLESKKMIHIFISTVFLFITFILMDTVKPTIQNYELRGLTNIALICCFVASSYFIFMGLVWSEMEHNSLSAAKSRIKLARPKIILN